MSQLFCLGLWVERTFKRYSGEALSCPRTKVPHQGQGLNLVAMHCTFHKVKLHIIIDYWYAGLLPVYRDFTDRFWCREILLGNKNVQLGFCAYSHHAQQIAIQANGRTPAVERRLGFCLVLWQGTRIGQYEVVTINKSFLWWQIKILETCANCCRLRSRGKMQTQCYHFLNCKKTG